MRGPGIFSFKVLKSSGKVLEFCSVISVATLPIANVINPDQSNQDSIVSFHQYADDSFTLAQTHQH